MGKKRSPSPTLPTGERAGMLEEMGQLDFSLFVFHFSLKYFSFFTFRFSFFTYIQAPCRKNGELFVFLAVFV